ncbi:MAG TPA: SAVED domain-containing protein [Xanthobacteraceae bacterium]|nr:SAVED domain-containing protein [Xanthobacteraceae bacterium]
MTDPTGRSFLSYKRSRRDEAALLIQAQHDHGIPTWQDVADLGSVPTEDELRRVLADPATASGVLFITPEVAASPIITNVEVPKIIQRAAARDGFFVVPLAAGGLDYAQAADATSNHLSAQNLADWNMHKVRGAEISVGDAAEIANRVLTQRLAAIHRHLPKNAPLRLGLFVRRPPAFDPGTALMLDWSNRFSGKEATPEMWRHTLLPALERIAKAVRQHAPGRIVEAFGLPTLPAAAALGCAFLSTSGLRASWRQIAPGRDDQIWTLVQPKEDAGFKAQIMSKEPSARDIAVLVSIADNAEPVFASYQKNLPPLRAIVHTMRSGAYPHLIRTPGEATDVALTVQDGMRTARREYGDIGTAHLFMAAPAGVAMLIGQLLNTFGAVQTYEHIIVDGHEQYRPAALLHPNL